MSELTKEQCEEIRGRVEPIATCKSWESPIMEEFCLHAVMDVPNLLDTVASLRAKLDEAKGALKYYAEKKTYYCTVYDPASGEMVAPVLADDGACARAALSKLEAKQ